MQKSSLDFGTRDKKCLYICTELYFLSPEFGLQHVNIYLKTASFIDDFDLIQKALKKPK